MHRKSIAILLVSSAPAAAQWHLHTVELGSYYYTSAIYCPYPTWSGPQAKALAARLDQILADWDSCIDGTAFAVWATCGDPPDLTCIRSFTDECDQTAQPEIAQAWADYYAGLPNGGPR